MPHLRQEDRGLCTLTLKVDVLYTYRDYIGNTQMLIERNELDPNNYINDGQRAKNMYSMVLTKAFPTGFDTPQFYLTTAG